MTTTNEAPADAQQGDERKPWRVGKHYCIHVYERDESQMDDRPVATFHRAKDALRAVAAVNAARPSADTEKLRLVREAVDRAAAIPTKGNNGLLIGHIVDDLRAALDGGPR